MGDRANVKVEDGDSTVFLYTHWDGSGLPIILKNALLKKERWDDGQYLARIIFQEMIGSDESTTGYGISSVIGDGDNRILIVNIETQTVSVKDKQWPFTEYINMDISTVWGI